jgi:adenosylcobyric acid synthase
MPAGRRVGIVRYPTASNLDEFKLLEQVADVTWVGASGPLESFDLVVLPGSKHVAADLDWLRRSGLAAEVVDRVGAGLPVLGICGGLQMLGMRIGDPVGVDGTRSGLGLLAVETVFGAEKLTERVRIELAPIEGPFATIGGRSFDGYEIRYGETTPVAESGVSASDGMFAAGSVLGVTAHGLLDDPSVLEALFGSRPSRTLEQVFDELAELVEERFDIPALGRLAGFEL